MDRKNDSRWFNEMLRIEKEQPFAQRKPDDERDLSFSNALTETQIDDYFAIDDRLEYLRFVRSHKDELSDDSYQWLFEDIPNLVVEEWRVTSEDLEKFEREAS
ncbi:MAG: hypothetical protein K2O09_04355 [Treponemataceae bacterium]|nr:hypothetical protein [Treponemataceae bacterium]